MGANAPKGNEELLERGASALEALTVDGRAGNVPAATEALVEVLAQVRASRELRASVGAAERELLERNERAISALKRVDQDIIMAKVDAVQVFEERDQVARDLSRAKTAMVEIEEFEKEESASLSVDGEKEKKKKKKKGDESVMLTEKLKEVEEIEEKVVEALKSVEKVETELLMTADEVEKVRKRKKVLRKKLSAAQGEW